MAFILLLLYNNKQFMANKNLKERTDVFFI